jgi:hypothetical protein
MIDNGFAETDAKDGLYLIIGDVWTSTFELFNRFDIVSRITWTVGEEETVKLVHRLVNCKMVRCEGRGTDVAVNCSCEEHVAPAL